MNGIAFELDDTGQSLQLNPATIPPAVGLLDALTVADEIGSKWPRYVRADGAVDLTR